MVSETRWRVGRVVHIYNSGYGLTHFDHHGRRTRPRSQPLCFTSDPTEKDTLFPHIAHCFIASTYAQSCQRYHTTTTLEICIRIY